MSDEDDMPIERASEGEALLYDYFKHLTSLCLFSLGGVLAMVDTVKGTAPIKLIVIVIVIGLAAICSFGGAAEIVQARFKGKPLSRYLNFYRLASPILLSFGLGMFLWLFTKALGT